MAKERKKRVVLANPDEPRAGDYAYEYYRKSHPVTGQPETIQRLRNSLKGLRGEEVTMTFRGKRLDPDTGVAKRFRIKRTFTLNSYRDVFGPGSAYASAIHYIRDAHSEEELVVDDFVIEESEYGDEDSEYDE